MADIKFKKYSKEILLDDSNYQLMFEDTGSSTINYTGGTYSISSSTGTKYTNTSANSSLCLILPDAETGLTYTIENKTADMPAFFIYQSGSTIDTTLSKCYTTSSGQSVTAICNTGGTWSFEEESTVNLWADYTPTTVFSSNSRGGGISDSGKYSLIGGETNGYWLSTNYTSSYTQYDSSAKIYAHPMVSAEGKYQYYNDANSEKMYQSSNYGSTFTDISSKFTITMIWNKIMLSHDGKYVYIFRQENGDNNYIYRSDNYGSTFSKKDLGSNIMQDLCLSRDGKYVYYVVSNGQIYRSVDYGVNYTSIKSTSKYTRGISCDASGKYCVVTGYADRVYFTSNDFGSNWTSHSLNSKNVNAYTSLSGKFSYIYYIKGSYSYNLFYSSDFNSTFTGLNNYESSNGLCNTPDQKYGVVGINVGYSNKKT